MARILGADSDSLTCAAEIVRGGGIVAFPTDTVYGLGCDPWNGSAVDRVFEVKEREGKPIPVLCPSPAEVGAVVEMVEPAVTLAKRFWPGALTIVVPLRRPVPWALDQRSGLLGVRVPGNELARALALNAGGYITGTSANISGQPSCRSANEVEESLGDWIDAVVDGGVTSGGASTVVKVVDGSVEVLRRGAIAVELGITQESLDK